jgi:hypothetical protein
MTPCNCEYSELTPRLGRAEKSLRLYPTSEPGLYIPHVVAFINFPEEHEKKLSQISEGLPTLLARVWGILDKKVLDFVNERNRWSPGGENISPAMRKLAEELEKNCPSNPVLLEYKKNMENPPGQEKIAQVRELLGGTDLSGGPIQEAGRARCSHGQYGFDRCRYGYTEAEGEGNISQASRFEGDAKTITEKMGLFWGQGHK